MGIRILPTIDHKRRLINTRFQDNPVGNEPEQLTVYV